MTLFLLLCNCFVFSREMQTDVWEYNEGESSNFWEITVLFVIVWFIYNTKDSKNE